MNFQSIHQSNSPQQTSPYLLLTFKLFTLSRHSNNVICQQQFKLIYYHTVFNIICRLSPIYNPFKNNLYLVYLLLYHLLNSVHKQSFQDHSTIPKEFLTGFAISKFHQCLSAEVFSAIFHIHLKPFQDL